MLPWTTYTPQITATHCNTLQHVATHCNALQHTATNCKTIQHNLTHSQATLVANITTPQASNTHHPPLQQNTARVFLTLYLPSPLVIQDQGLRVWEGDWVGTGSAEGIFVQDYPSQNPPRPPPSHTTHTFKHTRVH